MTKRKYLFPISNMRALGIPKEEWPLNNIVAEADCIPIITIPNSGAYIKVIVDGKEVYIAGNNFTQIIKDGCREYKDINGKSAFDHD